MAYIRLLNFSRQYVRKRNRFASYAFQDPTGVSVIDLECAQRYPGGTCGHILKWYARLAGTPILFWQVPDSLIEVHKDQWHIEGDASDGDECHHIILGVEDNEGGRIGKGIKIEQIMICDEGSPRQMTDDDVIRLLQA